jgi:hypothetical protein
VTTAASARKNIHLTAEVLTEEEAVALVKIEILQFL